MAPDKSGLPAAAAAYLRAHPELARIDALYADLCGVVRGKRFPAADYGKLMTQGLNTPGSVFLLDVNGESHDPLGLGFSDGDPDCYCKAIPETLRPVPWAEVPTAQVMVTFQTLEGEPYFFEPRNVLARVLERFKALKLQPVVAFELEFYLIDRERTAEGRPQPPLSPISGKRMQGTQVYGMGDLEAFGPLMQEITDACAAQGIRTGAVTTEYAPGQYEINLHHSADPLAAADQCVMFQRVVRCIAQRHGVEATFMAKPYPDTSGSGLHLHCSLLDEAGANVFAAGESENELGPRIRHAMGGALALMGDAMAVYAPNLNSFRRFQPNIYVPLTRSWDRENRSVALRVPIGGPEARRIEKRIAGADANPYLTLATFLAGLHHGLTQEIDPGPATKGNAGQAYDPDIPFRPKRALERLAESRVLADYLGEDYVKVYVATKEAELERFEAMVSRAEFEWYLLTD